MFAIVYRWPFFIAVPTELQIASERALKRFALVERCAQDPEYRDTLSQIEQNIGDIRARAESIDREEP